MRCVYYITNSHVTAYHWQNDTVTDSVRFNNDQSGLIQLEEWLSKGSIVRSMILCDIVEEEFMQSTVPSVSRRDLKHVLRRKLKKSFRDTPFCISRIQGQSNDKRKTLNVTLSAITNSEMISALLNILKSRKVPVAGVYSTASLSCLLLKKIKCTSRYNILISQQEEHMRLSYCEHTNLKSSRLSQTTYTSDKTYFSSMDKEVENNQRYLKRTQLLPQGDSPDIYIVGAAGMEDICQSAFDNNKNQTVHFLAISELCALTGLKNSLQANQADFLYVHLLCSSNTIDNYSRSEDKLYHYLNVTKQGLLVASIIGVTLALSSSFYNVLSGINHKAALKNALQTKTMLMRNLSSAKKPLASSNITAKEMRAMVNANIRLRALKTDPLHIIRTTSQFFSSFQKLSIDELSWKTTSQLPLPAQGNKQENDDGSSDGEPEKRYELVTIKGHVTDFDGNYVIAQAQVRKLRQTILQSKEYTKVYAMQLPININSRHTISGESANNQKELRAEFTLILIRLSGKEKS